MKNGVLFLLLVAALLVGCEPAPSTPLAPDHKMPDASTMSQDQVNKMIQHNSDVAKGRG